MRTMRDVGLLLLGIGLVLGGLRSLLDLQYRHLTIIQSVISLAAGVLLVWSVSALLRRRPHGTR